MPLKNSRILTHILTYGYPGLVVGAALSGGIVSPLATALFASAVIFLLLIFALKIVLDEDGQLFIPDTLWPFLALIILTLVQSYAWTDRTGVRQSLSLDVEATRNSLFIFVILFGAFLLGANIFRHTEAQKLLTNFLVIYGLLFAFLALVLSFAWKQNLTWLKPIENGNPFGPFVNRNHFAGYMELLFPLPVALLLVAQKKLEQSILYIAAAALMGIALCFSLSRGGMISLGVQLLFLLALSTQSKNKQLPNHQLKPKLIAIVSIAGIVVLMGLGIYLIGANSLILRFGDEDDRAQIWLNAWHIFQAHPWLGTGAGTFETAFPIYALDKGLDVAAEAHSDYLQILSDTGLTGFVIFLLFLVLLVRTIGKALRATKPLQTALALGSSTSIVGILVHSFFDFNLQLPSHALLFFLHVSLCAEIASVKLQLVKNEVKAPVYQVLPIAKESL